MKLATTKFKKGPFSWQGYTPFKVVKEKTTRKTSKVTFLQKLQFWKSDKDITVKTDYKIHCGPLKPNQTNMLDLLPNIAGNELTPDITKLIENKWMPQPQLAVFDHKEKKSLTAAEAITKRRTSPRWMPMYYQNPMQSYDYLVYESLFKNTILGPVMTQLVKFIMGTGFEPELELRNPSGDAKKDKALIEKHQKIISNLKYVDRCLTEKADEDGMDMTLKQKFQGMFLNTLVFNRSCAVKIYDKKNPIEIPVGEGEKQEFKKYPGIPTSYIEFHPRDIGIIKISPENHKLIAVQIQQISGFVDDNDLIYFWNSEFGAPVYLSKYYGASMCMPMVEPCRLIRNQVASILPAVAENMAGGLYHIFVEPQGGTETQKEQEYSSITEASEFGTSNVFMISPDRVKYENVNFDPKIAELISMFDAMIKYVTATAKLPQIGFYDESAANHATAVEKIQLTMSTSINPIRDFFGEELSRQHYMPIFSEIYKKDSEESKLFRIKVRFDDLQVETLKERAEAIAELHNIGINLDPEKLEELTQIDGLQDHMEKPEDNPNSVPPGTPANRMDVKDKKTGDKFSVTSRSS